MPEEEKKTVPIDTSGPDAEVDIEETKDESVVETEAPKQETETVEQEPVKQESPKLPKPTGWRMLVLPFKMKEKQS